MSSPSSSRSASPDFSSFASAATKGTKCDSEPFVQICIKPVVGEVFPITVPSSTTIKTLCSLVALRTNTPETGLRILHNGTHLSNVGESLVNLDIAAGSTLHMSLPLRPKRNRCHAAACTAAAQKIVGDCSFCAGHFCAKHRMLEAHACPELEACKAQEKERNREKLESERTFALRGL